MFNYDLPEERIAQRPVHPAESAKLLVYNRATNSMHDTTYSEIVNFINPGDIFVFNNSKVIPARFFGQVGEASSEILLLRRHSNRTWVCIGRPMRKFLPNTKINIFDRNLNSTNVQATIINRIGEKEVLVEFNVEDEDLFNIGTMPIPPYIRGGKADENDITDYQSIFAKQDGSVAAPTASLHFSTDLISKMKTAGAQIEQVTLHVGSASFLPLWSAEDELVEEMQIKTPGIEFYKYDQLLLDKLLLAKKESKRIIAVGTTVVRALESMIRHSYNPAESNLLETDLFIKPGFEFKICSNLVTNFHQPRTTHLMLVSAFCSEDKIKQIYNHALNDPEYRFLSYGDGMFII